MWLPDKLYELLPSLYSVGGAITINLVDSSIGCAYGCLLFLTGGVIFMMRRDYRNEVD